MSLWQDYEHGKQRLRESAARMSGGSGGAADGGRGAACSSLLSQPEVAKWVVDERIIDETLNEFYLWHGTKPETAEILAESGFDERVANLGGLYGAGSYFADTACKSNQYAKEKTAKGERVMLYCRVLMGEAHMTKTTHSDRRPPINPAAGQKGRTFDSIFAQKGVANDGKQFHNEYVVFKSDQCYPEFIVYYTS